MRRTSSIFGIIISMLLVISLCACSSNTEVYGTQNVTENTSDATPTNGATQSPDVTQPPEQELSPAPSGKQFLFDEAGNVIQQADMSDYSLMWWRDGFNKGGAQQMNMQTGTYGLAVNTSNGSIKKLGVIKNMLSWQEAACADNALIESLDGIATSYFALDSDGVRRKRTGVSPIGGPGVSSRILESGRYVSRIDVMSLTFESLSASGRVEIAAMPDYLTLELGLWSPNKKQSLGAGITIELAQDYKQIYRSEEAVTFAKQNGEGLSIIAPEDAVMEVEQGKITVQKNFTVKANDIKGLSLIIIPSANASGQQVVNYLAAKQLSVQAEQISPYEGRNQSAKVEITKGYISVDMNRMNSNSATEFQDQDNLNKLDRLKLTISNPTNADISLPVQLVKEGDFAVEGMSCMLRDINTGEPTGNHVQVCRNWHSYTTDKNGNYAASDDPKRIWSGRWFHGYTVIDVPAGKTVTYEVTVAYPMWGGIFACSHSQLCLAGWGGNYQQWETSTVGSFSDSFCYDIEKAHGTGAAINDVLPLLAYGSSGQKYAWPSGVSGSDFFAMYDKSGKEIPLKQLTTRFIKQGPCITEVVYSGITKDESVKVEIKVNMSATNDAAKATYTLDYTFLKDVEFSRLYFFSLGSDEYNTNFSKITFGNTDGGAEFDMGGTTYTDGTIDIDYNNVSTGYFNSQSQQRVDISGEGLYVLERNSQIYDQTYGIPGARMINMLSWSSEINGKRYDKPSLSLMINKAIFGAYDIPCAVVELGVPLEAGNVIKKGSRVQGIIQFIPLPTHIGEGENGYYGFDEGMLNIKGEGDEFIKNLAEHFVKGEKYSMSASVGEVTSLYPATVKAVDDSAQVTLTGGAGHVAVTFSNLSSYAGYSLEQKQGDAWVRVDRSVYGNDYWQCFFDVDSATYQLTFNLPCSGDPKNEQTFRLVKIKK